MHTPRLRAPRALIFDLDGTLVDSHPSIAASVDAMLRAHDRPLPSLAVRELALSRPLREMAAALTGVTDPAELDAMAASYMAHYVETMVAQSTPFTGVEAMLDAVASMDVPLAVLTNKTEINAIQIVHGRFGEIRFPTIVGSVGSRADKPSADGALLVAATLGVPIGECWMIGDSEIDVATAHATGMVAVGVTWGITASLAAKIAHADVVIDEPAVLAKLVVDALS